MCFVCVCLPDGDGREYKQRMEGASWVFVFHVVSSLYALLPSNNVWVVDFFSFFFFVFFTWKSKASSLTSFSQFTAGEFIQTNYFLYFLFCFSSIINHSLWFTRVMKMATGLIIRKVLPSFEMHTHTNFHIHWLTQWEK